MLFGPSLLRSNREAGQRFVTAYLRGVHQYASEGKTDHLAGIIAKRLRLDLDFVRRMCWPYLPADGHVSAESLDHYQKWALREGLIDRVLAIDEVWDRSFVDHANRRARQRRSDATVGLRCQDLQFTFHGQAGSGARRSTT